MAVMPSPGRSLHPLGGSERSSGTSFMHSTQHVGAPKILATSIQTLCVLAATGGETVRVSLRVSVVHGSTVVQHD